LFSGINNYGFTLDKNNLRQEIKIKIINDNLVEPFEFFTLNIVSVTPAEFGTNAKKVVYIEDNDCRCFFVNPSFLETNLNPVV
jgi:hypothetical protein